MAWCFSTRASVATVLTTHPCVSRCLRVKIEGAYIHCILVLWHGIKSRGDRKKKQSVNLLIQPFAHISSFCLLNMCAANMHIWNSDSNAQVNLSTKCKSLVEQVISPAVTIKSFAWQHKRADDLIIHMLYSMWTPAPINCKLWCHEIEMFSILLTLCEGNPLSYTFNS